MTTIDKDMKIDLNDMVYVHWFMHGGRTRIYRPWSYGQTTKQADKLL